MSELESAWELEPRTHKTFYCEADDCEEVALWRLRIYGDGLIQSQAFHVFPGPRWVCDAHKVEPQPPTYKDWLALQEAEA